MRILFDHGTPAPLISFLAGHTVTKAIEAGWDRLVNGELLKAAENVQRYVRKIAAWTPRHPAATLKWISR